MGIFKEWYAAWKFARAVSKEQKVKKVILKNEKEQANIDKEPWVGIVGTNINYDNLEEGNFDLDWNDIFIARLIKAGYRGRNDQEIVDQWFQVICSSIAAGDLEQEMSDPEKRAIIQRKRLEDGRVEHS